MSLDAASPQPTRPPATVTAYLVGEHDAPDLSNFLNGRRSIPGIKAATNHAARLGSTTTVNDASGSNPVDRLTAISCIIACSSTRAKSTYLLLSPSTSSVVLCGAGCGSGAGASLNRSWSAWPWTMALDKSDPDDETLRMMPAARRRCGTRWMWAGILVSMIWWSAQAAELSIAVEHVRSGRGTDMIGLYDNAEGFDRAVGSIDSRALLIEPRRYAAIALQASAADGNIVTFSKVQRGHYAAIAFQDENDNAKLDKNIFGMPSEPYGFSNNVRGLFGAPAFEQASIAIDSGQELIRIMLTGP